MAMNGTWKKTLSHLALVIRTQYGTSNTSIKAFSSSSNDVSSPSPLNVLKLMSSSFRPLVNLKCVIKTVLFQNKVHKWHTIDIYVIYLDSCFKICFLRTEAISTYNFKNCTKKLIFGSAVFTHSKFDYILIVHHWGLYKEIWKKKNKNIFTHKYAM